MRLEPRIPDRRSLRLLVSTIAGIGSLAAVFGLLQEPPPSQPWPWSTLATEGMAEGPLKELDERVGRGEFGYVDRLVVARNGRLVFSSRHEHDYRAISRGHEGPLGCGYRSCEDDSQIHEFNYYHPDFHPYHRGRDIHSLQSVTKSIAATLVGIALHRAEISGVDANLLDFFADYDLSGVDARLRAATLADLLTMRSGIEWHETDRPFDGSNTTLQLESSADWIQFTLNQPSDAAPGSRWAYNSGGSHLMSGIIRAATGDFIDAFAERHLFGPLGIRHYHWKKTPKGYPDTEGGLYLEAEDLARIGQLYLQDGVWRGRRLLPEGWVAVATSRLVEGVNSRGDGYGYQWWRIDRNGHPVWAGLGFGGQLLVVVPRLGLVGVVNSWNIFGGRFPSIRNAFVDALIRSVEPDAADGSAGARLPEQSLLLLAEHSRG